MAHVTAVQVVVSQMCRCECNPLINSGAGSSCNSSAGSGESDVLL